MEAVLKLFRLFLFLITVLVILLFGTFIYLKPQWQNKVSSEEMEGIVHSTQTIPLLDKGFLQLYKKIYPERFHRNYLTSKLANGRSSICEEASYPFCTSMTTPERVSFFHELESRVSQEECFNYRIANYDFLNQGLGLEKASERYFQKKRKT